MTHRKDLRLPKSMQSGTSRRFQKLNRPPSAFVWQTREMLESVAWRSLPSAARKVLDRLLIEHMGHGGNENGNLICTHDQISAYGVRRPSIANAVRALEYFGFVRTAKGVAFKGEHLPTRYRITWLPTPDCAPATNEWQGITDAHVRTWKAERAAMNTADAEKAKMRRDQMSRRVLGNVIPLEIGRAGSRA
jgi:hypothetical protein